jgi:hypothetical protein
MGLDRLEADRVMDVVREQAEKVRGAREKVKEPRVEAKKADASRRRLCRNKVQKMRLTNGFYSLLESSC